ncbi:hypothetical protein PPN31119_00312 [Pandoraea pnomenusa]|uniref:Uncharacterized protein n=1 Tax=Pandoraea pnomenusa TaxID=93220 RepID=A0ABY6WDR3_9BURK|nr:hypothetical protein PPN31119_00312 [Pandoraea pnomenusa]
MSGTQHGTHGQRARGHFVAGCLVVKNADDRAAGRARFDDQLRDHGAVGRVERRRGFVE